MKLRAVIKNIQGHQRYEGVNIENKIKEIILALILSHCYNNNHYDR
jgi:hypothetical protein